MKETVRGEFHTWTLFGSTRNYADIHLPYNKFTELIQPICFNAITGRGEQRSIVQAHVKRLRSEIMAGNFTPTQFSANLNNNHRKNLKLDESARTFEMELDSDDPLPNTDGGHRTEAIRTLIKEYTTKLEGSNEKEHTRLQGVIDSLNSLSIGVRVYFDGLAKRDFLNLQAGRTVDATQITTMKILQSKEPEPKLAFEAAKALNSMDGPFKGLIRFDSRVQAGSLLKQIPFSTLSARSAGDLSTSLIGLAKVGLSLNSEITGKELAAVVVDVFNALEVECPEVMEKGKVLTPIRNGGTKGSATMLIGLATCLLYRGEEVEDENLTRLVECARECLDVPVEKNFSGSTKRSLMGNFAERFFGNTEEESHDSLPLRLLETLSPSTYNAAAFPRKKRGSAEVQEPELASV